MSNPSPVSSGGRRQGRMWILTIPHDKWKPCLPEAVSYIRGQREIGAGGFDHWQVVAYLKKKGSLATLKGCFCAEVHGELTRSEAAEGYVFKDETAVEGTRFELGQRPFKRNSKTDWERVWQLAVSGDLESIPPNVRVQRYYVLISYNALRRIRADYARPEPIVRHCFVFHGTTGTGKSRRAWDEAGFSAYPKSPSSKFWDGYQSQKHVVLDEFRGEIGIGHLLRWLDRYPCLVEIKGSSVVLAATTIWITSNLAPEQWYPDVDQLTRDALLRRLDVTHFKNLVEFDE